MKTGHTRSRSLIRNAVAAVCVGAGVLLGGSAVAAEGPGGVRPNVVLIFADDLGYGDVGCYGGKMVPTPAIDPLARDGVRLTDGYVTSPVSAPSRCGLLTGAYNQRFGMEWNEDRARYGVGGHRLLPQALKAAGYTTGHIGKWNMGAKIEGCFDETYDVVDWEADYFAGADGNYRGVDDPKWVDSSKIQGVWGPELEGEEYLTDRMGRHAVEFVEKHREGPFFLYLAFNAVHTPLHAKAEDKERFSHLEPPLNFYASMVKSLDENVGRVLGALEANGLDENTIVVFISDNGPARGSIERWPADWPGDRLIIGSAGPLAGHKAQYTEGGIRVPFIWRWPGKLKPAEEYRRPVSTMDVYPTLCAAAGAQVPEGTRVDGVDVMPFLRGEKEGDPHEILFWKSQNRGAARKGDYKMLVNNWTPKPQLFDLASDIGETKDLANERPELVAELHAAWEAWHAQMPSRANPPK